MESDTSRNGRPSKAEQLEIQEKLRPYFQRGISPFVTSKETGINRKTVNKYFDMWYAEIKSSQNEEFIERCKFEKEQALVAIDNELLQLHKIRKELEKHAETQSKPERWLYKLRIDVSNTIVNFVSLKTTLANSPTADIMLKQLLGNLVNSKELEGLKDVFA